MIKFFDMFSGIGGFRAGLERAGGFECIGHCEIDKPANAAYRAIHNIKESEVYFNDAKTINTDKLPDFDLLTAGFPCQAFSLAGKRKGFSDPRGTLFFEIARVVRAKRPAYLLLENVPGLLSHDKGRTFATILHEISCMGYRLEWQMFNAKDFGVPQSRRRVYIIGYLDERCAGKVFPICGANPATLIQLIGGRQDSRVYDVSGLSCTLKATSGGAGGKTGLYAVGTNRKDGVVREIDTAYTLAAGDYRGLNRNQTQNAVFHIKEATKKGYSPATPGDSVTISFAGSNTKRARVGKGFSHTLTASTPQGVVTMCGRIRRLTPRECLRLQGFDENQIDQLLTITSDHQAYKQAGNAVTVNVVHALGLRIKAMHDELNSVKGRGS